MDTISVISCSWGLFVVVHAASLLSWGTRGASHASGAWDGVAASYVLWMLCSCAIFVWGYLNVYVRNVLEVSRYETSYVTWDMIDVYTSLLLATHLVKNASSSVLALHLTWSVERGSMQYRQTLVTCTCIGFLCSGAQVSLVILLDRNVHPTAMYIQWHLVEMVLQIMSATGAFSLVFYRIKE